ncbi:MULTISPECIES: hypothetical protein [Arthrobacter]|uniref:DUF7426 domain-containing protein n=2 Tax=Arthrobacter TaxID=1663 RepID=A0ABU9KJP5_9MICC|nr:hypothetical protein [Arthrobacter sp. YJM1]MDP5226629.1 hypothetical protein [Arthrobacter sp. YJM1]
MSFAPLEDILGPIVLTMRGQEFTLPTMTAEESAALRERIVTGMTEAELTAAFLGEVGEEMFRHGISLEAITKVALVAFVDWFYGREASEKAWADPELFTAVLDKHLNPTPAAAVEGSDG